jgi:hypothetical protein
LDFGVCGIDSGCDCSFGAVAISGVDAVVAIAVVVVVVVVGGVVGN